MSKRKNSDVAKLADQLANGLGNGTKVQELKPRNGQAKANDPATKEPATPKARKSRAKKPAIVEPEAATPVVETPKPVEEPKPVAKPNPLEELFQVGEALSGMDVLGGIAMTNNILTDQRAVATFVKAMSDAEALAIQELGFKRLEAEVKEEWYALSFAKVEAQLQTWSRNGSAAAKGIVAIFATIRKLAPTVDAIGPLWQLYTEIIRPAKNANSYPELANLLRELFQKGLVERDFDRKHYPSKAIKTKAGDMHHNIHLPAMERGRSIPMIEAGWPFLKEAEVRAKAWAEGKRSRLDELKGSATKDFSANDAEAGNGGTIFIQTGENRGALLQVHKTDGGIRVRVIGMPLRTPTEWLAWDAKQEVWPDKDLYHAFKTWRNKVQPTAPATTPAVEADEKKPKSRRKKATQKVS
jgi:hypothetical protein